MARTMAEELLERGFEQGIEQGARENAIENILLLLTERFPNSDAEGTKQRLQAIHDIERLRQLLRTAMKTPNLETFLRAFGRKAQQGRFGI